MKLYKNGADIKIRAVNGSKTYYTGSTHKTNNCGDLTVIAQIDRYYISSKGYKLYIYFIVQFADGTKVHTISNSIQAGSVKNPNQPSVFSVGFEGQGPHKCTLNKKSTKLYRLWYNMMKRCYSENCREAYPTYAHCTVVKRWHNFQNFCDDAPSLQGYTEWKKGTENSRNPYDLDKDTKLKGNKVYAKESCVFISHKENSTECNRRIHTTGKTYTLIRLSDGKTEVVTNQSDFCRKYNLRNNGISSLVNNKIKNHKGWVTSAP